MRKAMTLPSVKDLRLRSRGRSKPAPLSKEAALIAERGKVYGDPKHSHTNIGLSWTGLLQQHYGITLDHPIPPALVAQMMVTFKMQRSARAYHEDNYDDARVYAGFAQEFQKGAS